MLKHTDALISLDMHQFLKSDPIKRLDQETKYRRLRQYLSERWGPHSSLDVAKIKADLTSMRGDDPGWRKYLQNFNYLSLEQTLQRDANDAIIYGPASAAEFPVRPLDTTPAAEHTVPIDKVRVRLGYMTFTRVLVFDRTINYSLLLSFSIFFCLWYGHNDHFFLWVEENLSR